MSEKLKPRPFCGSEPKYNEQDYLVECECGAFHNGNAASPEKIFTAWNRRTPDPEEVAEIIKEGIRESVVSYQKVIECAVRYIAQQQQCPPNYLRSSLCSESVSCEKCWCEWLANTAMKHEEASQCQD